MIGLWLRLVAMTLGLVFAVGLIGARGRIAVFVLLFVRGLEPHRHVRLRVLHRPRLSGYAFVRGPGSLEERARVPPSMGSSSS